MGSYEQTMLKLEKMAQTNTATQMNWQEKMSKSSHQMEVSDLVKAGLNPVLSSGGSGAQSYTTSVDSAVNGIAGMASARESASATRFAARQSAAATRAAAAAQLQAAQISAAASERNNIRSTEAQKYGADMSYKSIIDAPQKNPISLIDKYLLKNGNYDKPIRDIFKTVTGHIQKFSQNPTRYFQQQKDQIRYNNFKLNKQGIKEANKQLSILGIAQNANNRELLVQASLFGKPMAINLLGNLIKKYRSSSARIQR